MTIATLAAYQTAAKQLIPFQKAASGSLAAKYASTWKFGNVPAAGSDPGNTANGLVPDNTTTGALAINAFSGTGYLSGAEVNYASIANPAGAQVTLFDRLFHAGAYAFNASTSLASQPSFSARVPGSDYTQCQLWIEFTTTFVGQCTIAVTYTDQAGNTGHTTGTVQIYTAGAPPQAGNMAMMPLASGDCGIQKVESVTSTVASAGAFNVLVLRPLFRGCWLWSDQLSGANFGIDKCGMLQVYPSSCLMVGVNSQNNAQLFDGTFEIASG